MVRRRRLSRGIRPGLRWLGHLGLGAGVGALVGIPFADVGFGAAAGAIVAALLAFYFSLRTKR